MKKNMYIKRHFGKITFAITTVIVLFFGIITYRDHHKNDVFIDMDAYIFSPTVYLRTHPGYYPILETSAKSDDYPECTPITGVEIVRIESNGSADLDGYAFSPDKLIFNNTESKEILTKKLSAILSGQDKPDLDIFDHLLACGGQASVTFYTRLLNIQEYDIALYGEAVEGQDIVLSPKRYLILIKNNHWFILSQRDEGIEKSYKEFYDKVIGYSDNDQDRDINVSYAVTTWNNEYNTPQKTNEWIKSSLKMIKYK